MLFNLFNHSPTANAVCLNEKSGLVDEFENNCLVDEAACKNGKREVGQLLPALTLSVDPFSET